MGIKDLTAFLRENAPSSITKGNLSQFNSIYLNSNTNNNTTTNTSSILNLNSTSSLPKPRKLRAAIDTSLFMYKYKYKNGDKFIIDFLEQINRLLINNIEPIYVFDGVPPSEKMDTLKSRKERKENYNNKIKDLQGKLENIEKGEIDINSINVNDNNDINELSGNVAIDENGNTIEVTEAPKSKEQIMADINSEINKIKRKTISVSNEDIGKLTYFLDLVNIRYIKKNMEADIVCSKLSSIGLVDFVISEDMDHLTSGTRILLRDFNNRNNYVTIYSLDAILNTLDITHDKLIDLCILFGCDYVSRIRGLGYKTSYKYFSSNKDMEFETLVNHIVETKKCTLPPNYIEKVKKAQTIFRNNIDIGIDESFFTEKKEIFDNQIKVVKDYLSKYTNFSEQKIKNRIKNIFGYCI